MKKICSIVIIFVIFILISNSVFAIEDWMKENRKREEAFKSALKPYMESFMKEETPEEDRIISYEYTGFGGAGEEKEGKLEVTISVYVTPVNDSNTTWFKTGNCLFATFSKVNDEYVLDKVSRYPDNYDEFLKRFEEYKKSVEKSDNKEKLEIQGENQKSLANQEIQKINNNLIVVFAILFVISGILLIFLIRKRIINQLS